MKVYVVITGCKYEGFSISNIFRDKSKAQELQMEIEDSIEEYKSWQVEYYAAEDDYYRLYKESLPRELEMEFLDKKPPDCKYSGYDYANILEYELL